MTGSPKKHETSPDVGTAIRKLRSEVKMTQVQFAAALELTPTTIYRYEAATGEPSNDVLAKMLQLAIGKEAVTSIEAFVDILSQRTGMKVLGHQQLGSVGSIHDGASVLSLQDRILVMALIVMLRESSDETARRTATALLEPWMQKAKAEFKSRNQQ